MQLELQMSKILDKAADLIDERGWTQGTSQNELGQICAGRAIQVAAQTFDETEESVPIVFYGVAGLQASQKVNCRVGVGSIAIWNDQAGRTQEEVTQTFRAVAQELRENNG